MVREKEKKKKRKKKKRKREATREKSFCLIQPVLFRKFGQGGYRWLSDPD